MRLTTASSCLTALSIAAAADVLAQTPPPAQPDRSVIVATGSGTIERAANQARVSIAAESRAATPGDAQRLAAEAMTSVLQSLETQGLSGDAVRTLGYTLQPDIQYDNGRARVRGYIARNLIEVRVDDLTKLGAAIDAAGASGATSMSGLRFDLKDRAAVEREALELAVKDAVEQARAMAAGAGMTLGRILRIEQQGGMSPPPMPYMAMRDAMSAAAPETPINPGEIELRAQVTLTVEIR
jgi:uncharacterized protein YggE